MVERYGKVDSVPSSVASMHSGCNTSSSLGNLGKDRSLAHHIRRRRPNHDDKKETTDVTRIARSKRKVFLQNSSYLVLIGIPMALILLKSFKSSNRVPTFVFITGSLVAYAFDLSQDPDKVFISIILTSFLFSFSVVVEIFSCMEYGTYFFTFLKTAITVLHISCFSAWAVIQISSLISREFFMFLEAIILSICPLSFACIGTVYSMNYSGSCMINFLVFSTLYTFSIWLTCFKNMSSSAERSSFTHRIIRRTSRQTKNILLFTLPSLYFFSVWSKIFRVSMQSTSTFDFGITIAVPIIYVKLLFGFTGTSRKARVSFHTSSTTSLTSKSRHYFSKLLELYEQALLSQYGVVLAIVFILFFFYKNWIGPAFTKYYLFSKGSLFSTNFVSFISVVGMLLYLAAMFVKTLLSKATLEDTPKFGYVIALQLLFAILLTFGIGYKSTEYFHVEDIADLHAALLSILIGTLLLLLVGFIWHSKRIQGQRFDMEGGLLVVFCMLFSHLEASAEGALEKFPSFTQGTGSTKHLYFALLTSSMLVMISHHLRKKSRISLASSIIILSVSIGKVNKHFCSMANQLLIQSSLSSETCIGGTFQSSFFVFCSFIPFVFFAPPTLRERCTALEKKEFDTKRRDLDKKLMIFHFVIFPSVCFVTYPAIIRPLIHLICIFGFSSQCDFAERAGYFFLCWGFYMISTTVYLFHGKRIVDYTANSSSVKMETISVIVFVVGIFGKLTTTSSNSWIKSSQSTWGLFASSSSFLLVATRIWKVKFSQLGKHLFLFGFIFGGGIAWILVMEVSVRKVPKYGSHRTSLFIELVSCILISSLGIVTILVSHYTKIPENLKNLKRQFFWYELLSCSLLLINFLFGASDGSISTSLFLYTLVGIGIGFAFCTRKKDKKSCATKTLGNFSFFVSWILSIILIFTHCGIISTILPWSRIRFNGFPKSVIGTFVASLILTQLEFTHSHKIRGGTGALFKESMTPSKLMSKVVYAFQCESNQVGSQYYLPVLSISLIFSIVTIYAIFVRGCFVKDSDQIPMNYFHVLESIYGPLQKNQADDFAYVKDIANLAEKHASHQVAVIMHSKLLGSGFCTSRHQFLGPSLHFFSFVASCPTMLLFLSYLWRGRRIKGNLNYLLSVLPLNLFPIFLFNGIPTLQYFAILGLIGGIAQILHERKIISSRKMEM